MQVEIQTGESLMKFRLFSSIAKAVALALCLHWFAANTAGLSAATNDLAVQFKADAMCCKSCGQKIAGQLYATRGVKSVQVHLAGRTVDVVAAGEKGPSLGELWNAVEQGGGEPTQLTTAATTITLKRPEADAALNPSQCEVRIVGGFRDQAIVDRVAKAVHALAGVMSVSLNAGRDALIIQSQETLSPWAVLQSIASAGEATESLTCSLGEFTLHSASANQDHSRQQARNSIPGGIQK
jgi:copper chaperone CopZ